MDLLSLQWTSVLMIRQILKQLEDSILELQVILPTMLNTIIRIRDQCQKLCRMYCEIKQDECCCHLTVKEFDECAKGVEICVRQVGVLKERVNFTMWLVRSVPYYTRRGIMVNV